MALTKNQKIGIGVGIGAAATLGIALAVKAAPPIVCTPGAEKCIGPDWCRCKDDGTGWIIITPNATECAAPPGAAILHGTVKDASTMAVIDGIVVDCGGYTDTTVADGKYRIENILPGTYSVRFSDPSGQYQEKVV